MVFIPAYIYQVIVQGFLRVFTPFNFYKRLTGFPSVYGRSDDETGKKGSSPGTPV
jgi:hypothetical protein